MLNNRRKVKGRYLVSIGTMDTVLVHARGASSCNEFITGWRRKVRLNGAYEREAEAWFFMARLTSNVR
jgi:hypothetical protein